MFSNEIITQFAKIAHNKIAIIKCLNVYIEISLT